MEQPRIIIIAGPNGAGKTTFAREFLVRQRCEVFINADLIAAGLSPFAPERVAIRAGRLMLQAIDEHAARSESFAFETTLSGLGYARKIPAWRKSGYRVELHFLCVPSADESIRRVARRVQQGGHDIPADVIRRRFDSGLQLFRSLYADLVDHGVLYDNAEGRPVIIDWRNPMAEPPSVRQPRVRYAGVPPDAPDWVREGYVALLSARERAREVARRTGTPMVIWEDGQVIEVDPDDERFDR